MLKLIVQRLLLAIPTMCVIIGVLFALYQYLPGDPIEATFALPQQKRTLADSIAYQEQYQQYAHELGLDQPLFFFSLTTKKGFVWHGWQNQYVAKVLKICKGDFGISYRTKRSVWVEIAEAIRWTLLMNTIAIVLLFLIGGYLGMYAATHQGKRWDKILVQTSLLLDALPSFWIATLLVVFFTTAYYGMHLFPNIGLGNPPYDASFGVKILYALPHLILPIFCLLLSEFSIIFRQMRASALEVLQQDYIRTAMAKGLPDAQLLRRHILPNAIFPTITLLGNAIPGLIAGSALIENIFNIPGMGKLTIEAFLNKDFPILFAIISLIAVFTIIGNLVADVLYRYFDPRLR